MQCVTQHHLIEDGQFMIYCHSCQQFECEHHFKSIASQHTWRECQANVCQEQERRFLLCYYQWKEGLPSTSSDIYVCPFCSSGYHRSCTSTCQRKVCQAKQKTTSSEQKKTQQTTTRKRRRQVDRQDEDDLRSDQPSFNDRSSSRRQRRRQRKRRRRRRQLVSSSDDEEDEDEDNDSNVTMSNTVQSSLDLPGCCLLDDRQPSEDNDLIPTAFVLSKVSSSLSDKPEQQEQQHLATAFAWGDYVYRMGSIVILMFTEHNDIKAEHVKFGLARVIGLDLTPAVSDTGDDSLCIEWLQDDKDVNLPVGEEKRAITSSHPDLIHEDDLILIKDTIALNSLVCPVIYQSVATDKFGQDILQSYSHVIRLLSMQKTHFDKRWYADVHLASSPLLSGAHLFWAPSNHVWQTKLGWSFFQSVSLNLMGRGNMSASRGDDYSRFISLFEAALALATEKTTLISRPSEEGRCDSCGMVRQLSASLQLPTQTLTVGGQCRQHLHTHGQAIAKIIRAREKHIDIDSVVFQKEDQGPGPFRVATLTDDFLFHLQSLVSVVDVV